MKLFRNKEIWRFSLALIAICAALNIAGFAVSVPTGIFALISCAVLCGAFFIFTKKRYRDIAELSGQIDKILHGGESFDIRDFHEGELSILHSDIQKMTVRLREQADALLADKAFLADALADIAHQIRTPMTSIRMLAAFLAKPETDPAQRLKFSREMEGLLGRIDWLLTTLLKISKIDAGTVVFEREKIPVCELIKRSVAPLEIPLELRDITMQIQCGEDVFIETDPSWTAEAIGNIVKNCMEHTPLGGKIEITCTAGAIFTEIKIKDNGSGIDPKDLPHIFERFYQGQGQKEGSFGVGLALCRMILSAQNAAVGAENNPGGNRSGGKGTCFRIKFYP